MATRSHSRRERRSTSRLAELKKGEARRPLKWRLAGVFLAVAIPAFTLYLFYLSQLVMARFEGTKWKIPSRIYSDALTLYDGLPLTPEFVEERLKRVSYRQTAASSLPEPGEYSKNDGDRWQIALREFDYPEGRSQPQKIHFSLSGGRVAGLEGADGKKLRSSRIEPEVISGLYSEVWESREVVHLDDVPQDLIHAVISIEDRRFYKHFGLDPKGLARAMWTNLRARRLVQGGSTISQQLVKNLFLTRERTFTRKLNELFMAFIIEYLYSKPEILETYLNEVYLGQRGPMGIHGVAEAARFYFGKAVGSLDLAECATIAGLIRSPGTYSPYLHPEESVKRRNIVLEVMTRYGGLPDERARAAREEPLTIPSAPRRPLGAPYFVDYVRSELAERYSQETLTSEGLKIFTSLDPLLQLEAEGAVKRGLEKLEAKYKRLRPDGNDRLQGILVSLDPRTGSILALVGGRDYKETQFNRVVQARRQPGSLFKPFVYAAAFDGVGGNQGARLTPATLLDDSPLTVQYDHQKWTPRNYIEFYRGPVTVYEALSESLNIPAARTGLKVGPKALASFLRSFGFQGKLDEVPSLALGAADVSPLETAAAFAVFTNEGYRVRPVSIMDVVDKNGRILKRRKLTLEEVIPPGVAYLVTYCMEGVLDSGTARWSRNLGFQGTAAGKTGTTNDFRDAWFVGFTPDTLALVWVGYDQGKAVGLQGAAVALPIWVDYMKSAGLERKDAEFPKPKGIVFEEVDAGNGLLATGACPRTVRLPFLQGTEPTSRCTDHPTLLDRLKEPPAPAREEAGRASPPSPPAATPPARAERRKPPESGGWLDRIFGR